MNIIFEGPNCCGKSTLINKILLTDEFNHFEVEHLSSKSPNTLEFHKQILKSDRDMIFDRFFIGELVYSEIYGRSPKYSLADLKDMAYDSYLHDGTRIVLCDADYDFIVSHMQDRGEEYNQDIVFNEKRLFNYYAHELIKSGTVVAIRKLHLDGNNYITEHNDDSIIKYLKMEQKYIDGLR